jgi:hypothetical protein
MLGILNYLKYFKFEKEEDQKLFGQLCLEFVK